LTPLDKPSLAPSAVTPTETGETARTASTASPTSSSSSPPSPSTAQAPPPFKGPQPQPIGFLRPQIVKALIEDNKKMIAIVSTALPIRSRALQWV
jgi:hypothetical protein